MSWFGPKGVATMTFSLLVLGQAVEDGGRIFNIAALTVFLSIVLHGGDRHRRRGLDRTPLSGREDAKVGRRPSCADRP